MVGLSLGMGGSICYEGSLAGNVIRTTKAVNLDQDFATGKISFRPLGEFQEGNYDELHPALPLRPFPDYRGFALPKEIMDRLSAELRACAAYFGENDATEIEGGQRDKAKRLACSSPPGSLGKEAICPNFDHWYVKAVGNNCAGEVGDLYERNASALNQPATDDNIEKWAALETSYFEEQGGCTALLGRALSQAERIKRMKESRDQSNKRRKTANRRSSGR